MKAYTSPRARASVERAARAASTFATSPHPIAHVLFSNCAIAKLIANGSPYFVLGPQPPSKSEKQSNNQNLVRLVQARIRGKHVSLTRLPAALTANPRSPGDASSRMSFESARGGWTGEKTGGCRPPSPPFLSHLHRHFNKPSNSTSRRTCTRSCWIASVIVWYVVARV